MLVRVAEALEGLPIPGPAAGPGPEYAFEEAHRLGGELPLGHLHLWGGPPGEGKSALLLALLHDAARRGRPALFATYDRSAPTLALRLLAMTSGVPFADLDAGRLSEAAGAAAARARARIEALPFSILEARGLGVAALEWHAVRAFARVEVVGVDFLEAVVRPAGQPRHGTLDDLGALARRHHAAVVVVSRDALSGADAAPDAVDPPEARAADRVLWLGPARGAAVGEARIVANRHGARSSCPLNFDAPTSRFLPPASS